MSWFDKEPSFNDESVTCGFLKVASDGSGYRIRRCSYEMDYVCEFECKLNGQIHLYSKTILQFDWSSVCVFFILFKIAYNSLLAYMFDF